PNGELGLIAGLAGHRAVRVDEWMQSSDPRISALGECCEFAGETFGLVEPIWRQCQTLASRLSGRAPVPFRSEAVATKLKVSGVQVFSAGQHLTGDGCDELVLTVPKGNVYRKLVLKDDRIVGIVLFGDTRDGQFYFELMQ